MAKWYLKDFTRPERIARRPRERVRKEEERMKPCRETRPKALWAWYFGVDPEGVETLMFDTWAKASSPEGEKDGDISRYAIPVFSLANRFPQPRLIKRPF